MKKKTASKTKDLTVTELFLASNVKKPVRTDCSVMQCVTGA